MRHCCLCSLSARTFTLLDTNPSHEAVRGLSASCIGVYKSEIVFSTNMIAVISDLKSDLPKRIFNIRSSFEVTNN